MPEQPQVDSAGPSLSPQPFHLRVILSNGEKATIFIQDILSPLPEEILSRQIPSPITTSNVFEDRLTIIESQLAWISRCITLVGPEEGSEGNKM